MACSWYIIVTEVKTDCSSGLGLFIASVRNQGVTHFMVSVVVIFILLYLGSNLYLVLLLYDVTLCYSVQSMLR